MKTTDSLDLDFDTLDLSATGSPAYVPGGAARKQNPFNARRNIFFSFSPTAPA